MRKGQLNVPVVLWMRSNTRLTIWLVVGLVSLSSVASAVMGLTPLRTDHANMALTSTVIAPSKDVEQMASAKLPSTAVETDGNAQSGSVQSWDRMVMRTAALQLTVKDVSASVDRIASLASQHGGYVASSETQQQAEYSYSTVTIQVPSNEFDQLLPILKKMDGLVVNVTNASVSSSDVTQEYTDLQSQLRNLQATESRMLALQAKVDTIDSVLAVDKELRSVQGDIETIQGRINYLSKRTEMSTITITLSPEAAPPVLVSNELGWQPLNDVSQAWNNSVEMLSTVASAIIRVGVFLWWTIPLALLGFILVRRSKRSNSGVAPTIIDPQAS